MGRGLCPLTRKKTFSGQGSILGPLYQLSMRGGSAVGCWTCDLQVAGSVPGRWLSRNIGQLSLASLRGSLNRVPASAAGKGRILTSAEWQVTLCDPIWHASFQ